MVAGTLTVAGTYLTEEVLVVAGTLTVAGTYLTEEVSVVARIMVVTKMQEVVLRVLKVTQDKLVSVKKLVLRELPSEVVGEEVPEVAEAHEEEVVVLAEAVDSEVAVRDLEEAVVLAEAVDSEVAVRDLQVAVVLAEAVDSEVAVGDLVEVAVVSGGGRGFVDFRGGHRHFRGGHRHYGRGYYGRGYWPYYGFGLGYGLGYGYGGYWPYYGGYGYDGYGGYDYNRPMVVYIQREDDTQEATGAQANYWHYCRNPEGYYPDVKECPDGWIPVAPQPPTAPTAPTAPTIQ